jgi:hypothetical protein
MMAQRPRGELYYIRSELLFGALTVTISSRSVESRSILPSIPTHARLFGFTEIRIDAKLKQLAELHHTQLASRNKQYRVTGTD